jgi:hypothetical protein
LKKFDPCNDEEVSVPHTPWLDHAEAVEKPFKFVYRSLHCALDEMGRLSLEILRYIKARNDDIANRRSEAKASSKDTETSEDDD